MDQHSTDVIVVGAGTVGSTYAWWMAEAGCKVFVLEAADLSE